MMVSASELSNRLERVRERMRAAGVELLLVRSTDRFLNEYVPLLESTRAWVSGFSGSLGEVVIAPERAYLLVDGRYWLQAETEVDPALYEVVKVGLGTGLEATLGELLARLCRDAGRTQTIGFEPDRVTPAGLQLLESAVGSGAVWKPLMPSPVELARVDFDDVPEPRNPRIRKVDDALTGRSVSEKRALLSKELARLGVDALWVQRLDEIAWLTNLRGEELPYQATFKAVALLSAEALHVGLLRSDEEELARLGALAPEVRFSSEASLWETLSSKSLRVAIDPAGCSEAARRELMARGATPVLAPSLIAPIKAKKTAAELRAMRQDFLRADRVVEEVSAWVQRAVVAKERVTEADFAARVEETFRAHGAVGLSFRVISAAGKNGARIHYSDPDPSRVLRRGELLLLDTGAYFEAGYATDLTRTFLLDTPEAQGTAEQRRYFTLVLKAAIAGMRAVLPEGATGTQLDALVRAPLWAEGLNYNHGTGHGVGINVHEFPPRISPVAGSPLEEGHIFSIEPGVYLPEFGGVRIENLCTVERARAHPGFLQVRPLTFSKLDERLIDEERLDATERAWLEAYRLGRTFFLGDDAANDPPPKGKETKKQRARR